MMLVMKAKHVMECSTDQITPSCFLSEHRGRNPTGRVWISELTEALVLRAFSLSSYSGRR
jgi:hypothetical protein